MKPMPAPMKTKKIGGKIAQNLVMVSRFREDSDKNVGCSRGEKYCRRPGSSGKEPLILVIEMCDCDDLGADVRTVVEILNER